MSDPLGPICYGCVHCGCDPNDPDDCCWECDECAELLEAETEEDWL